MKFYFVGKIIKAPLPVLAIPAKLLDEKIQQRVSSLVAKLDRLTRKYLSEIILNENKELTVIFSYKGRPSSVFFGQNWEEKNSKADQNVQLYAPKFEDAEDC